MRVVTYSRGAEERAGLVIDGTVFDIEACSSFVKGETLPSRVLDILASGKAAGLAELHMKLSEAKRGETELPLRCWAALDEVRLCAPIPRPPKVICLGLNYRDHAEEQNAKIPDVPLIFAKAPTAVASPGQPIVIPGGSTQVDYEGELAFIIARRVRRATKDEARHAIFGYCCMNDVTEREIQRRERIWFRAKSMDTFAPLGPWIVTADEITNPLDLAITTALNGRIVQSSSTKHLIFTPEDIVVFVTSSISLEPGDVISTGTPGGVGVFRKPQVFLKDGDHVEITISRIGTLSNPVRAES